MNATAQPGQSAQKEQKISKRTRSPAYPSISLDAALDKAKAVWTHEKKNPAPITALATDWGQVATSSVAALTASALKKYGLLEEVDGGKGRMLRLTQVAMSIILNDQENSAERVDLLKRCALMPKIHASLWEHFKGELPSDATLKHYLIIEREFNPVSVDAFIKDFRDTISFAKLSPSDKIVIDHSIDDESEPEKPLLVKPVEEAQRSSPGLTEAMARFSAGSPPSIVREFNFPLPSGVASLKVPFPLTQEDYDGLIKTIGTFKDGLVKKPEIPAVNCSQPEWEQNATALAEMGEDFNLVNFSYSHDIRIAKEIAVKNGFDIRLDLNKEAALFRKRQERK